MAYDVQNVLNVYCEEYVGNVHEQLSDLGCTFICAYYCPSRHTVSGILEEKTGNNSVQVGPDNVCGGRGTFSVMFSISFASYHLQLSICCVVFHSTISHEVTRNWNCFLLMQVLNYSCGFFTWFLSRHLHYFCMSTVFSVYITFSGPHL